MTFLDESYILEMPTFVW